MPGSTQRQDSTFVVVLVAGSAIMAIALGIRASMGVFLAPITDDLAMGTGTFALAMAIQNLVWGVGQPVAGALADRHGTRRVLAAGTIFYMLGMVVMAGSGSAAELHLSGFLSGVGMAGASFTVVLAAVGRLAPEERRSMALGIATSVGSVGQFLFVPLASVAINAAGWRTALLLGAVVVAAVAVICVPMRVEPSGGGSSDGEPLAVALRRAAGHRSYVLLVVGFFVCGFHVSFIGVHLPKYLDDVGQTAAVGAMALALIGLFNVVGSLGAGALGRHPQSDTSTGPHLRPAGCGHHRVRPSAGGRSGVVGFRRSDGPALVVDRAAHLRRGHGPVRGGARRHPVRDCLFESPGGCIRGHCRRWLGARRHRLLRGLVVGAGGARRRGGDSPPGYRRLTGPGISQAVVGGCELGLVRPRLHH